MSSAVKSVLPKLYQQLINECKKFSDYNFRSHAVRLAQYKYEHAITETTDPGKVAELSQKLETDIAATARQTTVGQLYAAERHILDTNQSWWTHLK